MMRLGVLDQVPHFRGRTAEEAIQESVLLAREAEQLGYQRFWIAEHHNMGHFACGAPEILVAAIAAQTTTIRVGSGGVMLPNYSPLKVAETFRLLNTLYAGRIDLGLGRSTGANGLAAQILQPYLPPGLTGEQDPYLQQVRALLAFLAEEQDTRQEPPGAGTPYPGVRAVPVGAPTPEVWLLGSGQGSAAAAASLGLAFSFAQFVHARPEPQILETYRRNFRPSRHLPSPRTSLAVRVLCAESAEEADRLARSFWQICMGIHQRMAAGTYPYAPAQTEAQNYIWSASEQAYMREHALMMITGTPDQVKARLETLVSLYETDELLILTICPDLEARLRSYRLLAEACGLVMPSLACS